MAAAGRGGSRFAAVRWWVQCAGRCRSCCLIDKVSVKVVNGVTTGKRFTKGDIVNLKIASPTGSGYMRVYRGFIAKIVRAVDHQKSGTKNPARWPGGWRFTLSLLPA